MSDTKLLIVADDLTGGLDTGVQFTRQGITVRVVVDPDPSGKWTRTAAQVLVAVSETRHMPPGDAYETVYRIISAGRQAGIPYFYKKTDSALRGNIGAELGAALKASGAEVLSFLPAYPAMNRVTVEGCHLIDGVPAAVALLAEEDDDGVVFDLAAVHALGKEHDFSVVGLAASSGPEAVTAAQVRSLVLAGDVAGAHTALGRPHRVEGVVVHGAARGRELLGFPTANLDCPPRSAVPADGVYAGWLLRLDTPPEGTEARWPAAVSVGTNPTFDGQVRTVEAYALDRDDLELYGLPMAVEFTHHIRPMLRFDSIDELIEAMQRDVDRCRELLAGR